MESYAFELVILDDAELNTFFYLLGIKLKNSRLI